jgi:hypothetical protein
MAVAITPSRSVLWDHIRFTGSPADFAWVLPVTPGSTLEASTDDFFNALEAWTSERIDSPALQCNNPRAQGCAVSPLAGCGSDSSGGTSDSSSGVEGAETHQVTVVADKTVGPYEAVTLHSTDGAALYDWLQKHGFHVPDGIGPVIDAYVSEGADFIALRLLPSEGISAMRPVRVITPGGNPVLPLRMVKAGVGASVPITLWIFAEQRATLTDFPEVFIDWSHLTWDWSAKTSNYPDLLAAALAQNKGKSLVTTFASPQALAATMADPRGVPATLDAAGQRVTAFQGGTGYTSLAGLYFGVDAQTAINPTSPCNLGVMSSSYKVVAGTPASGEVAASQLACNGKDDLAAAATGMHPASMWLSRVQLDLPVEALTADCTVGPSVLQEKLPSWGVAATDVNAPCRPQQASIAPRSARARLPLGGAWLVVAASLLALRRFLRRGPS